MRREQNQRRMLGGWKPGVRLVLAMTLVACGFSAETLCARTLAATWHVAVDGAADGDGSAERPWGLATAFEGPAAIRPGDTLLLHEGVYRGGATSKLKGSPEAPIVVRGEPGRRVTFDLAPRDEKDNATLFLLGADATYRDFEVTCSHPLRVTKIAGPWPADIRRGSIDIRGDRIKAVNLVVHDLGSGFGLWSEGEGGELSGCLIYYNGWKGPDRGHGHAIYAQNARGTKRIADNILFHQFGYGIHVYGSEKASLRGFDIEGNIAFDNGCLTAKEHITPGIMVGGGCPAERIVVRDNVVVGGGIRLGYPWGTINEDLVCEGNYCEGSLIVRDFQRGSVERNTIVAHSGVAIIEGRDDLLFKGLRWDKNRYFLTDGRWGDFAAIAHGKSRGVTWEDWRKEFAFDAESTFQKGPPDELKVFIRPSPHEQGRAHVCVMNPRGLDRMDLDLSSVLESGQGFRIQNARDFFGPPLVRGKYAGQPISVTLTLPAPPPPVGLPDVDLPQTEPRMCALVVVPEL